LKLNVFAGSVLGKHLKSFYGFIKPDGKESFYDNIFFNPQVCEELDDDADLTEYFEDEDRCGSSILLCDWLYRH